MFTQGRFQPLVFTAIFLSWAITVSAHPLGQYTINHYARLETGVERIAVRYVVDLAELAAFAELRAADTDGNGTLSATEKKSYLARIIPQLLADIRLTSDGQPIALQATSQNLSLPPGLANLPTMRIECELVGALPATTSARRLHFEDRNHAQRQGWHEVVVVPGAGVQVFDSTAYGNGLTDELKAYPEELLLAPLNERAADWAVTSNALPAQAKPLLTRAGKPFVAQRDRLAELIAAPTLTPMFALFALLLAFGLGAVHALSPGHGKTIVGAYLVGSKGTAKHAAFLGLTVTITHTSSVLALGLLTLFAARYIVPEKLYPILSLVSGGLVLTIGLQLLVKRLRRALGWAEPHQHSHGEATHDESGAHQHTHLPPEKITWRNLLALGISGGLVPCPSALVVMLSAIAFHRVAFGLLLIVAFSLGLAGVLTAIGIAFVYAGRRLKPRAAERGGLSLVVKILPVLSASVIAVIGVVIMRQALTQTGIDFQALLTLEEPTSSLSAFSVLMLGLLLGLKHAIEADHLAAVTTIVTERKSLLSSTIVGGLWGIGHTIPILVVGLLVILLRLEIKEYVGLSLEFCVGLMLIGLGANALWKLTQGHALHLHAHEHGAHPHVHPHFHHEHEPARASTHHGFKLNLRPLLVGVMHGLAGSAALVPLVVAEIRSPLLGLVYMLIFGLGSIGGMMLMSALVGLPLHLTAVRFTRFNTTLRWAAGVFSLGFGLVMVYQIGWRG
jgi:ABC-type nickel/cobalt efflux system permease component RcnA